MSNKVLQPLLATTFDHLLKTTGRNPEGVVLCYKHRGVWIVWSWRKVVAASDRYASGLRSRELSGSLLASFFTTRRRYRPGPSGLSTIEVGGVRQLLGHNDAAERLFTTLGVLLRRIAPEPAGVEAKSFSSGGPLTCLALSGVT